MDLYPLCHQGRPRTGPDHAGESPLLSRSGGEKGLRGSGAGTLGVPLGGPRRVGGLLGVAGRLSGTVSPFRAAQRSPEGPRHLHRIPRLSEAPWDGALCSGTVREPAVQEEIQAATWAALKGETVPDSLPATPKSPLTRRVPPRATLRLPGTARWAGARDSRSCSHLSPRGTPACRGTFGGLRKAVRDRFALQGGTGDFL